MSNPQPGQAFGNYTIISEQAPVGPLLAFKAYSSTRASDVTLLLLPPALAQDGAVRARFELGAANLRGLKHPRVLAVYDAGQVDGVPYLAQQTVDARTLSERLEAGSLSLTEITRILGQLADALTYLQSNGVTLAALAPENVLFDEQGNIYLADLGLARLASGPAAGADPTAPAYALGSLLSTLIRGHGGADASLDEALQRLTDPLPLSRKAEVASAYEQVVRKATSDNPAERFASPADLLAAWQQAAVDAATATVDVSPIPPAEVTTSQPPVVATTHPVDVAAQRIAEQSASDTHRAVMRRLLRTIQLVAIKRAALEVERMALRLQQEQIARATQALRTPSAELAQEVISAVPAATVQRSRRVIGLVGAAIALLVCGIPALCFVCVAVLPSTSETPTPRASPIAAIVAATRRPTTRPATAATPLAQPATPAPVPTVHSTLVFSDNFKTGDCNLLEGDNDRRTFKCEDGQYTMLSKVDGSRWVFYDDEYQDTVIEVDAHAVSGAAFVEYGLVFRVASDGQSLYGFSLTRGGKFTVFRYQDDSFTDLLPYIVSSAVRSDTATNHLQVVMQQDRISVYANDVFLGSVTDSNLKQGAVGLFLNSDEPNAKAAFSNLRISTISP
ncbi:MAG TPA: protein kinase [Chloroflexota bacterium]|nr:protein kinase [Chloroflexota bacterium]